MSWIELWAVACTAGMVGAVLGPVGFVLGFMARAAIREWWLGR